MFTHKVEIYPRWQFADDHLYLNLALGPSLLATWDSPRDDLPRALFIDLCVELIFWTVTVTLSWIGGR